MLEILKLQMQDYKRKEIKKVGVGANFILYNICLCLVEKVERNMLKYEK